MIYDPMADRYFVADFAFTNLNDGRLLRVHRGLEDERPGHRRLVASTPCALMTPLTRGSRTIRRWASGRTAST